MSNALMQLKKTLRQGEVYRRVDLERHSKAVDRHLHTLIKDGTLRKLSHGLYYKPKLSKFGEVPPEGEKVVKAFLKDDNFLLFSPNDYNGLGLGSTQLYNEYWVYNHKRNGKFKLAGQNYRFFLKSDFPKKLSKEFLMVDVLNNLNKLAEDNSAVLKGFMNKSQNLDLNKLQRAADRYGKRLANTKVKQLVKTDSRGYA